MVVAAERTQKRMERAEVKVPVLYMYTSATKTSLWFLLSYCFTSGVL